MRPALAWFYLYSGENLAEWVERWAVDLVATLRERAGRGELRLAVDRLDPPGTDALRRHGVTLVEGQELTEHARLIKSPDEIALMRWTIRVCEAGMARMHELSVDGRTEQEIWAELHHENIRSGGEWIETRLLRRRRTHQPVVPGVLGPRRPARRHAGLRHRPDRAVRLLRRPLAVVDDRPRPDDGRAAHALQRARSSRSSTTWP